MAEINRATVPQEFYDITSARLLVEPDDQYVHCRLWKMALAAALAPPSMLGFPVPGRGFGTDGAPYQTDSMQGRLILSPDGLYDQTIHVVAEMGNTPGHTVRLNRPAYEDTTYTQAAREIPSNKTISTTPIAAGSGQVPLTLKRFAGPFDQAAGDVAPFGIDRFDTSVMLHKPAQFVGLQLKRDFDKFIDSVVVTLLDQANIIVRPKGFANDDAHAVAGDGPMSYAMFSKTERQMDDANVPTFPNGKRVGILTPLQTEQLGQDAQFNRQSVFEKDFNPLFRGTYWRSVGNFDLFKSNRLSVVSNAGAVPINYAQFFGPGSIGSGIGDMPRTAENSQDNYGERSLIVWLMYAAFATLDQRFIASVRTS